MINFYLFTNFIKHLFSAKTLHGVHSPFVYQLIDKVLYDFTPKSDYYDIENLRKQLLKNKNYIDISDLGAGSKINNKGKKQLKQIANNALKPPKLAQLIYRLVKQNQPKNILEFGTCLGLTTAYMSKAAPFASIISMEGCPQTAEIAKQNLHFLQANNVTIQIDDFGKILPKILAQNPKLDFAFIDGNHQQQATIDYFNSILPYLNQNTILIFDDIYWSKGMQNAWKHIKKNPKVTVTIDLFWIGLVFFRTSMHKEDFKIRF